MIIPKLIFNKIEKHLFYLYPTSFYLRFSLGLCVVVNISLKNLYSVAVFKSVIDFINQVTNLRDQGQYMSLLIKFMAERVHAN